jgi:hypothetical protein
MHQQIFSINQENIRMNYFSDGIQNYRIPVFSLTPERPSAGWYCNALSRNFSKKTVRQEKDGFALLMPLPDFRLRSG